MNETVHKPAAARRLAAIAALLIVAAVLIWTVLEVLNDPLLVVVQVVLLVVAVTAAWTAVTRSGGMRWLSVAVAVAVVVGIVVIVVLREGPLGATMAARLVLLLVAALLAKYALERDTRSMELAERPGMPVAAAGRSALIMNLKSGGGKAARFNLPEECRARGIEPIVLAWGDGLEQLARDAEESRARGVEPTVTTWGSDLTQLAHDAISRGVDVIGMAGGDGSQALVANIAAERGVPMVVIPAGTRNHFALDLGLDRDDVVGALDAYGPALERTIDLGDVNGKVFVNNVSMGAYAIIVQSPEYRDAKMETTLAALPQMLGPESKPFDLRFKDGAGVQHDSAHVIQVSNNPYGRTPRTMATRPQLDTGRLGVFALVAPQGLGVSRFLAQLALGHPERYEGYMTWSAPEVVIDSGAPIAVGLDGESLMMDQPLVFKSRPGVLRVRLPKTAIGYSPAALAQPLGQMPANLWRVALGKAARDEA